MAQWLWYSSVPGMAVPGLAQPAKDGTGSSQPWLFTGPAPVTYLDYVDVTTGKVLSPYPGNWYSMRPVNNRAGLTVPPPDGAWLPVTGHFIPHFFFAAVPSYAEMLHAGRAHNAARHARIARGEEMAGGS
jgi:hypothetical protein